MKRQFEWVISTYIGFYNSTLFLLFFRQHFFNAFQINEKMIRNSFLPVFLLLTQISFGQSRMFVNPGFEIPVIPAGNVEFLGAQNDNNPTVPGWHTTNGSYNGLQHPLEIWSSGYSGVMTAPGLGSQFIEINCSENSRIYQIIYLVQGEVIDYNFFHRGRQGNDVAEFNIYDLQGNNKIQVIETAVSDMSWKSYSGTVVFNGSTGAYQVGFEAISTSTENPAVGNFLDGVSVTFHPLVEFISANYSTFEHVGNNLPRIRIKGSVPPGGMNVTIALVGGTATPGTDFNINTNIHVPEGEYNGGTAVSFPAVLNVFDDDSVENAETVILGLQNINSGGQFLDVNGDGLSCLATTYKIIDNDICIAPVIQSSSSIPFCVGDTILLHVVNIQNAEWSTGELKSSIAVYSPGKYWVVSHDHNCNLKDSLMVETKYCDCNVVVPSAFTPNGDGMNDLFRPLNANKCKVDMINLSVFNRWGDLIFQSNDIAKSWDGTMNGEPLPIGVYLWTLEYTVHGENAVETNGNLSGNVTLLR